MLILERVHLGYSNSFLGNRFNLMLHHPNGQDVRSHSMLEVTNDEAV